VFSKPPIHYASSCLWDENGETLQYKRLMMGKHLRRIKEGRSRRKSGTSNYESGLTSVTGEQERRACQADALHDKVSFKDRSEGTSYGCHVICFTN
jgi:hypothetical protein